MIILIFYLIYIHFLIKYFNHWQMIKKTVTGLYIF